MLETLCERLCLARYICKNYWQKTTSQTAGNFSAQSLPKESPAVPDKEGLPKTDLNKELVKDEPTEVDHAKEDSVTQEPATEEISAVVSENIITPDIANEETDIVEGESTKIELVPTDEIDTKVESTPVAVETEVAVAESPADQDVAVTLELHQSDETLKQVNDGQQEIDVGDATEQPEKEEINDTREQVNSTVNNTETQETATDDAFDTVPLEGDENIATAAKKLSQHLQNQQSP